MFIQLIRRNSNVTHSILVNVNAMLYLSQTNTNCNYDLIILLIIIIMKTNYPASGDSLTRLVRCSILRGSPNVWNNLLFHQHALLNSLIHWYMFYLRLITNNKNTNTLIIAQTITRATKQDNYSTSGLIPIPPCPFNSMLPL